MQSNTALKGEDFVSHTLTRVLLFAALGGIVIFPLVLANVDPAKSSLALLFHVYVLQRTPDELIDAEATDAELYELMGDGEVYFHFGAAQRLYRKGDLQAFLKGARSPNCTRRFVAVQWLSKFDQLESRQALVRALEDDVLGVRSTAVHSLARIGDASCIPALKLRLEDPVRFVRDEAKTAILAIETRVHANTSQG
ncbi:MAG: HEAT repeat domain-containing protein [Planctomycetes bacterium]|nr:HEAT repeat domain-containing protein [Planctomycetota bacterium]